MRRRGREGGSDDEVGDERGTERQENRARRPRSHDYPILIGAHSNVNEIRPMRCVISWRENNRQSISQVTFGSFQR